MLSKSKKGIGTVIATALLLVVAVVFIVNFQTWFNTFEDSLEADVENKNNDFNIFDILDVVGQDIFFKVNSDKLML